MILTQNNDVNSTVEEDQGHDFGIDVDSMGILFKGFSDNLYSNKIGSIVREIASNCFDAHEELGCNKDVVITLNRPDTFLNTPGKISFRDFGVGLSPDRIKNIYSKYFSSTKRDTNGQIGGFGIGAKSPLAYTDIFEVYTVVDGIEYHYMVHRGQKVPRIELLNTDYETDRERGTEVIIPIKNTSDASRFESELESQLKFFDNIQYLGCNINNEYKIIKGNHFIVREYDGNNKYNAKMGLCIGKVAYPLDVDQLEEFSEYELKSDISLLFDIGELSVTMNREAVEYTEEAVKRIKQKITDAEIEIKTLKYKSLEDENDVISYIDKHTSNDSLIIENTSFNLPRIWKNDKDSKWAFEPFKDFKYIKPTKNIFRDLLKVTHYYKHSIIHKKERKTNEINIFKILNSTNKYDKIPLYRAKGTVREKELSYIKSELSTDSFAIAKLNIQDEEYFYENNSNRIDKKFFYNDLSDIEKVEFNKEYKVYSNYLMKYFIKHSKSYNAIEVTDEWWRDYRGTSSKKVINKAEITIRHSYGSFTTFRKEAVKVSDLHKHFGGNNVLIYCFQGEENLFRDTLYKILDSTLNLKHIKTFKISRANEKHLNTFKHAYHISTVLKQPIIKKAFFKQTAKDNIKVDEFLTIPLEFDDDELNVLVSKQTFKYVKLYKKFMWSDNPMKDGFYYVDSKDPDAIHKEIFYEKYGLNLNKFLTEFFEFTTKNKLLLELLHDQSFSAEASDYFLNIIKQNFKPFNYINKL